MKAILPVAGVGSRLRPQTHTVPKALVHVAGKPVLGHILDALIPVGVDEVVLVIGHLGEKVVAYVEENYDLRIHVAVQQELHGLGHAIHTAGDAVDPAEPVLIVLGDTIFAADLQAVVSGGRSAIGVRAVDNPGSFGVVEMVDGGRIRRLAEKPDNPPSDLAVVGVYYLLQAGPLFENLNRLVASGHRTRGEFQLTDALQMLIDQGEEMYTFPVTDWLDCGSPRALLETNRSLLARNGSHGADGARIEGSILIPPVSIAPSASVRESIIGPYVSLAGGAEIHRAVIRESIINEHAGVEDVLLADSLIGERAQVNGRFTRLNIGDSSDIDIFS